ncbi:hypothetical protein DL93DRAFT_2143326 [Clavulina sp. PMI_390]|nr:hypothetical protein DL93DRAFT_2143326 [Clavulina sp. PMI_390]
MRERFFVPSYTLCWFRSTTVPNLQWAYIGRRKRRGSFSPGDRERYEPRARYDEDYRGGGRNRSPGGGGGYRSSRFPDPYEAECPVPMRSFIDWFQHTHPDDYADDERAVQEATKNGDSTTNVGIKVRYEKYRKVMIAKQMDLMFHYHIKYPWFNEKYNPSDALSNLRRRVRRDGWRGQIDKFLNELEDGKHDPAPTVELVDDLSLDKLGPSDAKADDDDSKPKADDHGDDHIEDDPAGPVNDEEPKDGMDEGGDEANGGAESKDLRDRIEPSNRNGDQRNNGMKPAEKEEEVTVEPEGNQVLIRTIPPDIGRVKLEKICRNVNGFVHLALGDTMQKRNYYRAGWIKFDDDADMTVVIDRLSEEKIEGFKLHVTHSTRPFSSRARYAPEASRRPERIAKDLENIKRLAALLEQEAYDLEKLPEKLDEPRFLPKSKGGELPDEPAPETNEFTEAARKAQAKAQAKNELDKMALDDDDAAREPKDRGSVAVEERLTRLIAEMGLDAPKEAVDGDGDIVVQDEVALQAKKNDLALELYLGYLRTAFNCCYYCSAITDHVEELQRKCIKHIRRQPKKGVTEIARDERWEEGLDSKTSLLIERDAVDPKEHGGKSIAEETSKAVEPHVKQEDEGKFRCKTCSKLFKAMSFVEKHVASRHSDLVKTEMEQIELIPFYNNFALDPHKIQPFTHVPPPNTNGQSAPPEAFGLRTAPQRMDVGADRGQWGYYPPPGAYPPQGYGGPPPPPRGYPGGGRDRSPPRGGRLSDRVGGFAPFDGLPARPEGDAAMGAGAGGAGGGRRGGRGRRDSGGPPPPGAREDPRAAAGKKVSYYDIDKTAEGDVELSY